MKKFVLISLAVFISLGALLGLYNYQLWQSFSEIETVPVSNTVSASEYTDKIQTARERLVSARDSLHVPSVSAAVGLRGELIWSSAVGYADLEMNGTFGDHAPNIEGDEAVFYELHQNSFRKWRSRNLSSHKVNLSYKWAGGGLISTPSDMVNLGNVLVSDSTFINREIRNNFWEPVLLANGEVNEQQYAAGWRSYKSYATEHLLGEDTPVWMVHHGGVSKGSMNLLALFPDYELVINVSVNGREDDIDFTPFWFEVMNIAQPFLMKAEEERYGS